MSAGNGLRSGQFLLLLLAAACLAALLPVQPAAAAAPNRPKNVAAAGLSDDTVQVRWRAVTNALRYQVFHSASPGSPYQSLGKTTRLRFTHSGLSPNSSHLYVVRAINADGRSARSAPTTATTADSDSAPKTPTGLAPIVAFDRVDLDWSAIAGASGYHVLRATGVDGSFTPLSGTTAPAVRDEDVAIAQTYRYAVRSVGAGGISGTSFPARVIVPDCGQTLDGLGVVWQKGEDRPIVPDPVVVTLPLNGVDYYAMNNPSVPQSTLYMDCAFAVALHRMADVSAPFDMTGVIHFGIYNYRCIAGTGTPPNCTFNNSAYGRAIDIAVLRDGSGETYTVEVDWVADADPEATCTAPTAGPKDEYLHRIVCAWFDEGAFDLILTPNYNDSQSNHISADVQDGAHFIK